MNILIEIGATSGIGYSLYSHYISRGDHIAIMGRGEDILDELCTTNPSNTNLLTSIRTDNIIYDRHL